MEYLGLVAAAAAAWIFGAVWYTALGKQYQRALGKDPEQCKGQKMPLMPLLLCFVGELVMAAALSWILARMSVVGWMWGAHMGLLFGSGIILPTVVINNLFPGRPTALMAIDGVHWIALAAIEGAVLGAFA
ncbi:MAG: DUF1761 domain-containing protein [Alphaproteobacteria bacterium]|nr:DUF1761 domain-containing protein [Alphaproteobacteria bacterium]